MVVADFQLKPEAYGAPRSNQSIGSLMLLLTSNPEKPRFNAFSTPHELLFP